MEQFLGRVPAGSGMNWIGGGWNLFKQAPGPWIGMFVMATPMNEIGTTEVLEWDVFFGKMDHTERAAKLQ